MSRMALIPISEPQCQRDIVIQLHHKEQRCEEAENYFEYLKEYFKRIIE
jgi:hypothetical protein